LNGPSPSVGDYQTNLDRPAASLNDLVAWSCKPSVDEASDHVAIEPMHERKPVLRHAVQNAVERRQCRRCSLLRLGCRGGAAIRVELTASFAADGRQTDTGHKKHL
jgi:hypothetical protein